MGIRLYDALLLHIDFFIGEHQEEHITHIGYGNDSEIINIEETEVYCIVNHVPLEKYKSRPLCLTFFVPKGSKVIFPETGTDYIKVRNPTGTEYGYPFKDADDGARKCIELLHNVYGVKDDDKVKIKTEANGWTWATEDLPDYEKVAPRATRYIEPDNIPTSKRKRKKSPFMALLLRLVFALAVGFVGYLFVRDFIYYPLITYNGRYTINSEGAVDISNFKEWQQPFDENPLPAVDAVYVWCLKDGATLPHLLISGDPVFHTVNYKGELLRVLLVEHTTYNLREDTHDDFLGSIDRGGTTLNNCISALLGYGKVHVRGYSWKVADDGVIPTASYIYNNLRLFYWPRYTELFQSSNKRYAAKDMVELLHPPFNLSEGYRFEEISDFRDFMVEIENAIDPKKKAEEFYRKCKQEQERETR